MEILISNLVHKRGAWHVFGSPISTPVWLANGCRPPKIFALAEIFIYRFSSDMLNSNVNICWANAHLIPHSKQMVFNSMIIPKLRRGYGIDTHWATRMSPMLVPLHCLYNICQKMDVRLDFISGDRNILDLVWFVCVLYCNDSISNWKNIHVFFHVHIHILVYEWPKTKVTKFFVIFENGSIVLRISKTLKVTVVIADRIQKSTLTCGLL